MPEQFNTGNKLLAGWISTDQLPLAAGTYHRGMVLEFDDGNSTYKALAENGEIGAIYNGRDEFVVSAAGSGDCIVAGEISENGLVDSNGDELTLTEAIRAEARAAGFYIKRK